MDNFLTGFYLVFPNGILSLIGTTAAIVCWFSFTLGLVSGIAALVALAVRQIQIWRGK